MKMHKTFIKLHQDSSFLLVSTSTKKVENILEYNKNLEQMQGYQSLNVSKKNDKSNLTISLFIV